MATVATLDLFKTERGEQIMNEAPKAEQAVGNVPKLTGIYFKLTPEERKLIEQKMELAGIHNMSGYIRKM